MPNRPWTAKRLGMQEIKWKLISSIDKIQHASSIKLCPKSCLLISNVWPHHPRSYRNNPILNAVPSSRICSGWASTTKLITPKFSSKTEVNCVHPWASLMTICLTSVCLLPIRWFIIAWPCKANYWRLRPIVCLASARLAPTTTTKTLPASKRAQVLKPAYKTRSRSKKRRSEPDSTLIAWTSAGVIRRLRHFNSQPSKYERTTPLPSSKTTITTLMDINCNGRVLNRLGRQLRLTWVPNRWFNPLLVGLRATVRSISKTALKTAPTIRMTQDGMAKVYANRQAPWSTSWGTRA